MPNAALGLALGAAVLVQGPPSVTWHGAGHMLLFDEAARLAAAMVAGGLLGLNRNLRGKAAGMRTHALVALGAAMVTAAASHAGDAAGARPVMQGVITGIGFVGAGVILHPANGPPRLTTRRRSAVRERAADDGAAAARRTTARHDVRGLTTAASVWVAAGLGVTSGLGLWSLVMFGTLFALAILSGGGAVEDWVRRRFRARLRRQRARRRERQPADALTAPLPAPPPLPPPAPRA